MPFEGEVLPLSLQLHDFAADKYCRAVLRDESGASLVGSPFVISHIGNGKYTSNAALMPAGVDYIECTYETYDDAGFTSLSADYTSATDVFRFEIPDSVIVDLLNQILNKLNGLAVPGANINAKLVQATIAETVQDVRIAKALLERDPSTVAQVKESGLASASIDDNEISATVKGKC